MPRSFLVKKKRGASGGWQWKEPEQLEWKASDVVGKIFSRILNDMWFFFAYTRWFAATPSIIFPLWIFACREGKSGGAQRPAACPWNPTSSTISMCNSIPESAGPVRRSGWEEWDQL